MPSRDFTREDLFSSRMMSMHNSTHSSQMNTVGPAISLRTSCWLFPQKEQYKVFLLSPPLGLLISSPRTCLGEHTLSKLNRISPGSFRFHPIHTPPPPKPTQFSMAQYG